MTQRVMVTVKADSADKAKEIGRKLDGFTLDESQEPISFTNGEYLIFGEATDDFIRRNSGVDPAGPDIQLPPPDADVQ
jgi:hypothetical protein